MKVVCRVFAIALLIVVVGTGMYVFAEEVYEEIQDIQTEALLEEALESVDTELSIEESALEATIEIGVKLVEDEEYVRPAKERKMEVGSAKVLERTAAIKDKAVLEKYINASIIYSITDKENEYLMKLMKRGYSFDRVIEIYCFLQGTKDDLSILEQMYDVVDAERPGDNWLESAYAIVKGRQADELEVADVYYYVENGVTADEIVMAYELSLHADKPIREILDMKVWGMSWAEVVAECDIDISVDEETFAGTDSLREINSAISVAKITGNYVADVVDNDEVWGEYSYKINEVRDTCETAGVVSVKGGYTQ